MDYSIDALQFYKIKEYPEIDYLSLMSEGYLSWQNLKNVPRKDKTVGWC